MSTTSNNPGETGKRELIFQDGFCGRLDLGWRWIRERQATWRLHPRGGLEIRVEPGVADTVRNALVRRAPDLSGAALAVEVTVRNHTRPIRQYEQAGITWYCNGKPVFKLVKELIDGGLYIIPGRKTMATESVRLRLVVFGRAWTAQFRPEGEELFQTAATGELPPQGVDEVSVQCYNGPPDAAHWIRFTDFQIFRLM